MVEDLVSQKKVLPNSNYLVTMSLINGREHTIDIFRYNIVIALVQVCDLCKLCVPSFAFDMPFINHQIQFSLVYRCKVMIAFYFELKRLRRTMVSFSKLYSMNILQLATKL